VDEQKWEWRFKMKKAIAILMLFCTAVFAQQKGSFTDARDGKTYKTVKIGTQTWMAENLNYEAENSKCYGNEPANCQKYGRLYDWETAKNVCPSGWHLPNNDEWQVLVDFAGGYEAAGEKLKAKSGWNNNGNGTDAFGFAALPGGYGSSNGDFYNVGYYGYWWSATENFAYRAYHHSVHYGYESVNYNYHHKKRLFSVRCLQD
jgi:uncharacterized protein (TIGR02145 family)